jgi:ABC-2 type transport system ATP-binding protein
VDGSDGRIRQDASTALEVEGLTRRYGAFTAVDDVSFTAASGAIMGFLGPNGAGKTTTLRMILGLVAPTAGRVTVLGQSDVSRVTDRIGFLPEERGLYRRMTPVTAITFLAGLKGVSAPEARRRARALLASQGLEEAADRQIRFLSKGMAQKVQLLSTLAHEPDLVILDEPFSGLDPINQHSLERLIRDLAARGATVIFSTHVMQHAERLCDQVVLMAGGRKVFDGTVESARAATPRTLILEGAFDPATVGDLPGLGERHVSRLEGGGVRLAANLLPGAPAQETVRQAFARGLDISRFEVREPTLHDAFIVITEGAAAITRDGGEADGGETP